MNENKTSINWDIRIFQKVASNHWKYGLFNIEIFTDLIKRGKLWVYQ